MPAAELRADTLAAVVHALGDVPLDRILWTPRPGTGTERHLLLNKAAELVDGLLVRKSQGMRKALVEAVVGTRILDHVRPRRLGAVTIASGPYRTVPGVVRRPDVAFTRWDRLLDAAGGIPDIAPAAPDLVVEIPTGENTRGEWERKLREYFRAGTKRVWEVDPDNRTVASYTDLDSCTVFGPTDTLTGGTVLPGFALPLADLFDDPQLNPRR